MQSEQRKLSAIVSHFHKYSTVECIWLNGVVNGLDRIGSVKAWRKSRFSIMFNVWSICTKTERRNTFNLRTCGFYVRCHHCILNFKILTHFYFKMSSLLGQWERICTNSSECVYGKSFAKFWWMNEPNSSSQSTNSQINKILFFIFRSFQFVPFIETIPNTRKVSEIFATDLNTPQKHERDRLKECVACSMWVVGGL